MVLRAARDVEAALRAVGELLVAQGYEYAITVLGGAALGLLGIVERTTNDVDILGFATPRVGGAPSAATLRPPPDPLPEPLVRAARSVARDQGLGPEWLNAGPALQWRAGLPPGLAGRVHWRHYPGLWVGIVDRYDLIFFKLFAAADAADSRSVHVRDLLALQPTGAELAAAANWVRQQDASPSFADVLEQVLAYARAELKLA